MSHYNGHRDEPKRIGKNMAPSLPQRPLSDHWALSFADSYAAPPFHCPWESGRFLERKTPPDALPLAVFSLLFFLAVLWFSIPGQAKDPYLDRQGLESSSLPHLACSDHCLLRPYGNMSSIAPQAGYASHAPSPQASGRLPQYHHGCIDGAGFWDHRGKNVKAWV